MTAWGVYGSAGLDCTIFSLMGSLEASTEAITSSTVSEAAGNGGAEAGGSISKKRSSPATRKCLAPSSMIRPRATIWIKGKAVSAFSAAFRSSAGSKCVLGL